MSERRYAEPITFTATVYKVQTLATDGGVRVALDLPETAIMQMAQLAECQRFGVVLDIEAVARPQEQLQAGNGEHKPVVRRAAKRRKREGDSGV